MILTIKKPSPHHGFRYILQLKKITLIGLIMLMVRDFGFERVEFDTKVRNNVEPGMWFDLTMEIGGNRYIVEAQRLGLLKERLIKFLDKRGLREDWLKNRANSGLGK